MITTPAAEEHLLRDALQKSLGIELGELDIVSREPLGRGSVAGYRTFQQAERDAPAQELVYYVDTSRLPVGIETGLVLPDPASPDHPDARIWLHPADPHLPALAPAAFGNAAATLLARVGITGTALPELIAYRPARRAVLRVRHDHGAAWVKIVRPSRVGRIASIHESLHAHGLPTPLVLAWSPEGLLVLSEAIGTPADALDAPAPDALIDAVDEVRTRLAGAPLERSARASLSVHRGWYANRLAAALTKAGSGFADIADLPPAAELAAHAADIDARACAALDAAPFIAGASAPVTVHGDLHLGQLFLAPDGSVSGLIDLDTAGIGDPADDSAAFIAHALASVARAEDVATAETWEGRAAVALARWSPGEPRVRPLTAIHLLAHALGASELGQPVLTARLVNAAAHVLEV